MDVILYVPTGSLELYKNDDFWKNFWDIRAIGESGISDISVDQNCDEIARYDLQGNKVTDQYKGIVIVQYSDNSVRKILQK